MARGRKRRDDWGSIRSISRDKHVIRYWSNDSDGYKRHCKTVIGSYRDAERERARLRLLHDADAPKPTVGDAYAMWYRPAMERKLENGELRERSFETYERAWRLHVAPTWEDTPVDQVRPSALQDWLLSLSQGQAHASRIVLSGVLDTAAIREHIASNPLSAKFEMPKKRQKTKSKATIDLDEAIDLLPKLRDYSIEAAYIIAAFGGARFGESLGVRVGEVRRIDAGGVAFAAVEIKRQMPKSGTEPLEYTKNDHSVRTALVPEPYGLRLLEIAEHNASIGCEWASVCADGTPVNKARAAYLWSKFCSIPFGNLRPSWRTYAAMRWRIDSDTLETLMGHVIQTVTGKHYLRPTVEQLAESFAAAYAKSSVELGKIG